MYMFASPFFIMAHITGNHEALGQPDGYRSTGWDLPAALIRGVTRMASLWWMVRRFTPWPRRSSTDGEGGERGEGES